MKKGLLGVSLATLGILYGLLVAIAVVVVSIAGGSALTAIIIAIVVLIVQFLIAPWLTDLTQKWFYKTQFGYEVPDYLREFIEKVCAENKIKYPKIGYIDDGAPNAFTYGRTKKDARIVLTKGIFQMLDEEEVKAVVAHELGHVAHLDMLFMTVAQLVPMLLYAAYQACMEVAKDTKSSSDSNNNANGVLAIVGIVALVLYLISQYIVLWLSRTREYYADAFSCDATGNPSALCSALVNIGFGLSTHPERNDGGQSVTSKSSSSMGIFDAKSSKSLAVECYEDGKINKDNIKNAMKWELWNVWAKLYELNSTHPLISKRIIAIDKKAKAAGEEEFIDFNLKKPESYVDDFFRELLISWLPGLVFIASIVVGIVLVANDTGAGHVPIWFGALPVFIALASIFKFMYTHPTKSYAQANVNGLLGEVKVSGVRSIPCELKGTIIGRGNPGCIFSEDFVLRDRTGIMFLDYNQPLFIINKIFAIFKAKENFDKQVVVKGWYRRSPVPYVELYSMEVDGKVKKCYTYAFGWVWRIIFLLITIGFFALVAMGELEGLF